MNELDFLKSMQNTNTAYDSETKETDIQFEKVSAEVEIKLPDYILHNDWVIVNQGATMLCVAFWTTAWINEELNMLWNKWDKNPNVLAEYIRKNLDADIDKEWTLVENWPIWARKLGWSEAYTYCKTIYDLKKALVLAWPISTGTNKINWTNLRKNNFIAVPGSGWWHFVNIVWYNTKLENAVYSADWKEYKDYFIVENTWWDTWWNKGRYFIPFEFALEILFNTKISNIVNSKLNKDYASKILANIKKEFEEKNVTPVVNKYKYFNWEELLLGDQENKNLFIVMQNALTETGYIPIFGTIIWSNENRTNARLLDVINGAKEYARKNIT